MTKFQVSVLSPEPSRELTILRIASAASNSVAQLYGQRRAALESSVDLAVILLHGRMGT